MPSTILAMALRRIYRRVDHGTKIQLSLVHEEGEPFPHYVDRRFDAPLEPGWRVESQWIANWDGGPGLRRDLRVLDSEEPFDAAFAASEATMQRAEQLALALVKNMRVWGATEPRQYVWQLGGIDTVGSAPDVLWTRKEIIDELAHAAFDRVPSEIDDPYGAFGPDGPPRIPMAVVGLTLAELRDVDPILEAIRALGVYVSLAN